MAGMRSALARQAALFLDKRPGFVAGQLSAFSVLTDRKGQILFRKPTSLLDWYSRYIVYLTYP